MLNIALSKPIWKIKRNIQLKTVPSKIYTKQINKYHYKLIKNGGTLKYIIINENPYIIFELLYIKYIKYLLFIKDIIKEYEFPKDNNIYWKSLKEYKI